VLTFIMPRSSTRPFESADQAKLDDVLQELRNHFHQWSPTYQSEHELVAFAFYEGCGGSSHCSQILARSAPLALGKELVLKHGFEWLMVRAPDTWHYAVSHPPTGLLIDLQSIDDGEWIQANRFETHDPGSNTNRSFDAILARIGRATSGS